MYIIIVILAIFLILIYMRAETTMLKESTVNFSTDPKGLKIVHLSDIHINRLYISVRKLTDRLNRISPDIIVMSGDYIEVKKDIPEFIELLEKVVEICPVYMTLGNHDHKAFKYNEENTAGFIKAVEAAGAVVLLNSSIRINKGDSSYRLIGIDDLKHGRPDIEKAFLETGPSFEDGCINIAVSHNPDMVFSLPEGKADYFLCGHFHGGQIWMPFNLEFMLLRDEKLCKMGYTRGLHKINGINMYINRGLGNVIFPFRFFSPPEIAVIQLPPSP